MPSRDGVHWQPTTGRPYSREETTMSYDADMTSSTPTSRGDGRVVLAPQRLKALRLGRGLSQESLAEYCFERRLCVSIASIKRAETGKCILYRTARHLAAAYEVPMETLVSREALPPRSHADAAQAGGSASACLWESPRLAAELDADADAHSIVLLTLLHEGTLAPASRQDAEQLLGQFGGSLLATDDSPGRLAAVFGLPAAYRSDIARCVHCADRMVRRLGPACRGAIVTFGSWTTGQPTGTVGLDADRRCLPALAALAAAGSCTPAPVLVERAGAVALADHPEFAFEEGSDASAFSLLRRGSSNGSPRRRPFIGRYAQLQQFKALLDEAQATQCGQVVHVRGPAGIGKSRLVHEFTDIAFQWKFSCHEAAALDFGMEARATPWAELVRSLLGLPGAESPDEGDVLQLRLDQAGFGESHEMSLRALLGLPQRPACAALHDGLDHAVRRSRAIDALHGLILRAAVMKPVVLLIEDMHWADVPFIEILAALLASTRDAAVTWLTTSRHDGDPMDTRLRPHCADLPVTVFDLAPMRLAEAEGLALSYGATDSERRSKCIDRARGNPLLLTQLLCAAPGQSLPESLRHLVQSQLDRMPAADRRALRAASVIGQKFLLSMLREVIDNPDYRPEVPERANLLKPSIGDPCQFVHDLVMHCIYESIAPDQRRLLHGRLAELYRDRDATLWARHLERAEDLRAPEAFLRAMREQMASHAYETVIELAAEASRGRHAPADRHALEMLAADAASRSMRNRDAHAGYERARDCATTPQERLDASLSMAANLNVLDRTNEEEVLLDNLLPVARELGNHASLARLFYLKGNICFPRGEFTAGRQLHEHALRYARAAGAPELEARSLSGLGDSLYAAGRMGQAHAVFVDCLALCTAHNLPGVEASNLFMRGTTRIYLGRSDEALQDALESAALGRRVGNRRAEIVSYLTASWILLSAGRLEQASTCVEAGLEIARSMGAVRFEPFLTECLARLTFLEGRRALALTQITGACEAMERLKLQRFIGPWLLSTFALLSDDAAARRAALRRAEALLADRCVAHNFYRFQVAAAEIALLEADPERAMAHIVRLQSATADDPSDWVAHHVRMVAAFGRWLATPGDDTRVALRALHGQAGERGLALAMPRLDATLRGL